MVAAVRPRLVLFSCLVFAPAFGEGLKPPFDGPERFARDRVVDYLSVRAEVSFDWDREEVIGRVTHRFRALRAEVRSVVLDAVRLTIEEARDGAGGELAHRDFDDRVEIDLAAPLSRGQEGEVTIRYRGRPLKGLWFIRPIPEYPDRRREVWTQGEAEYTRYWLPIFDSPAERLTSELIVTVPEGLDVLSNGVRVADRRGDDGTRTVHWAQRQEHAPYLICLAAGPYERLTAVADGVPLAFWYLPGDAERAARSFRETGDMLHFYSERFGRYPWPKYDQIVVRDFVAGGMENTSATFLTERTLHRGADEPHASSVGLVAHELAHQWFGDFVTCRDWADLWLNESFATFCSALWREHRYGRPEAQWERRGQALSYLREARDRYRRPLSCRTYHEPGDLFDRHSYPKGARILEMLRQELGDDAFFAGLRLYLERHRLQAVESSQLRRALEKVSGVSLGRFFHDWVHRPGHPELRVRARYDREAKRFSLSVEQAQDRSDSTPLYRLPVEVALYGPGTDDRIERIVVEKEKETFSFAVPRRPDFFRFDRRSVLLAEIDVEKPEREWILQLERDADTLGRAAAAERLGELLDSTGSVTAREALARRLAGEAFWGVRQLLCEALARGGGEDSARSLALALLRDADPRVRESAATALGRLGLRSALSALSVAAEHDASAWVRAAGLRALARIDPAAALAPARAALARPAEHDRLRGAAIDVLASLEDRESLPRLLTLAAPGVSRDVRSSALRALGALGRGNDGVARALVGQIDDPHRRTRRAVISALGRLRVRSALEPLARREAKERREEMRKAIDTALEAIRKPDGLERVEADVGRLSRRQEELERRLGELEKRDRQAREAESKGKARG